MPSGVLSLIGLALIVGLVVAAVAVLTGLGWALLASGLLGGAGCFAAEYVLADDDGKPTR